MVEVLATIKCDDHKFSKVFYLDGSVSCKSEHIVCNIEEGTKNSTLSKSPRIAVTSL